MNTKQPQSKLTHDWESFSLGQENEPNSIPLIDLNRVQTHFRQATKFKLQSSQQSFQMPFLFENTPFKQMKEQDSFTFQSMENSNSSAVTMNLTKQTLSFTENFSMRKLQKNYPVIKANNVHGFFTTRKSTLQDKKVRKLKLKKLKMLNFNMHFKETDFEKENTVSAIKCQTLQKRKRKRQLLFGFEESFKFFKRKCQKKSFRKNLFASKTLNPQLFSNKSLVRFSSLTKTSITRTSTRSRFSKDFQILKRLKDSKYSKLFLCKELETNNEYIVKQINIRQKQARFSNNKGEHEILERINFLNLRNTTKMIDSWKEGEMLFVQLEKYQSDLQTMISGKDPTQMETLKIIKDISLALFDLHSQQIAHLDIKPENIFLSKNGDYVLGNFFHSTKVLHTKQVADEGDKNYLAPEFLSSAIYGQGIDLKRADVYSFGVTIIQLLLPQSLELTQSYIKEFNKNVEQQKESKITRAILELLETNQIWNKYKDTIITMLQTDPQKRMTIGQFLSNF